MERSVPEFLSQMQSIGDSKNEHRILIIGATNKPWNIDGAFLRPGRFDEKIYIPLPDEAARQKMIDIRLKGIPLEEGIDFAAIAKITEGYNGADIDYLCEKAKEFALRKVIQNNDTKDLITKADFANALKNVKSSVLDSDRKEMEEWVKNN